MKKIKKITGILLLAGLSLTSCGGSEVITPETIDKNIIVKKTVTDESGTQLELAFNETKESVTINFQGETDELFDQKPASGIWYLNDTYELRGKGDEVELKKDGTVIFTSK